MKRLEADLAALREAAQAVVDEYGFDVIGKIGLPGPYYRAMVALRAVLASTDSESREETP